MRIFGWIIFAFFAIGVGLYPIIYLLIDARFGLLGSKSAELLANPIWNGAFYTHIFLGGIALLTGWSQFSTRIRNKNLSIHRTLGKSICNRLYDQRQRGVIHLLLCYGRVDCQLGFWSVSCFLADYYIQGLLNDSQWRD
jgi:hypothetical protein